MWLSRQLLLLAVLAVLAVWAAADSHPIDWITAGSAPHEYEFGEAADRGTEELGTAYIKSLASQHTGFGTLLKNLSAQSYAGKRVVLSGLMRTSDAGRAQMWLRVDGADGKPLAFDNMGKRPVMGTTAWTRYEIALDVPANAKNIAFGFLLFGGGTVWGDRFSLELMVNHVQ